jgi:hypothetical protein
MPGIAPIPRAQNVKTETPKAPVRGDANLFRVFKESIKNSYFEEAINLTCQMKNEIYRNQAIDIMLPHTIGPWPVQTIGLISLMDDCFQKMLCAQFACHKLIQMGRMDLVKQILESNRHLNTRHSDFIANVAETLLKTKSN